MEVDQPQEQVDCIKDSETNGFETSEKSDDEIQGVTKSNGQITNECSLKVKEVERPSGESKEISESVQNGELKTSSTKENGVTNSDDVIKELMNAATTVSDCATESKNIEHNGEKAVESVTQFKSSDEKQIESSADKSVLEKDDSAHNKVNKETEDDSIKKASVVDVTKGDSKIEAKGDDSVFQSDKAPDKSIEKKENAVDNKENEKTVNSPTVKGKKRKNSVATPPARIQPKRSASANISFAEPEEIEELPSATVSSPRAPKSSKDAAPVKENKPPKVTVIELGNSSLKLSEILRRDKKATSDQTKYFGNSSITISSAKSEQQPVPKVPQTASRFISHMQPKSDPNSNSALKSHLLQKSNIQVKPLNQPIKSIAPPHYKVHSQTPSIVELHSKKTVLNNISVLKQPESQPKEDLVEPSYVETIDEKEEYDKLEWENDNIFKIMRPGRFIPPSPNETMSLSMCNERLIECASKVTPFLLRYPVIPKIESYEFKKKQVEEPIPQPAYKHVGAVDQAYFKSSLGNFFMEIGQRLVSEWVQKDLVRSRKRKMEKEGETEASVKSLEAMTSMYEQLQNMNAPFHHPLIRCSRCKFKTESTSVLQHHLESPHVFPGTYKYSCTFCDYDTRDSGAILVHMKLHHNIRANIDPIPLFHQCPLCLYNSDKKKRMYTHISKCARNFKLASNLAPTSDYSYPARSFAPTWIHGQSFQRSLGPIKGLRQTAPMVKPYGLPASGYKPIQPVNQSRMLVSNILGRPNIGLGSLPPSTMVTKHQNPVLVQDPKSKLYKLVNTSNSGSLLQNSGKQTKSSPTAQMTNTKSKSSPITIIKNNTPVSQQSTVRMANAKSTMPSQKPSITLTPVNSSSPNLYGAKEPTKATINGLQSITVPYKGGKGSHTFVICEICDGYIRDLEQLRAHMQWMHKVKIHPKMIHNRPPLNCQKCQFRFFTDQGLERHLLGIHGLVTSNMQESANRGEDCGRCSACGKLFQSKLLYHISKVHKISLKPAHLSYKCTVCAATFTLYKLFETHVYSKHTMQSSSNKPLPPSTSNMTYKPGPAFSKKRPLPASTNTVPVPPPKVARVVPKCPKCHKTVANIERHWNDFHQRPFSVRLCHIEQCHKCLSEFDGFVVIHTEYFDSDDE